MKKVSVIRVVCLVGALVFCCTAQTPNADKILDSVRAKYASLTSYSDTGLIINEFGTDSKETHKFTTYFSRVPRGYYFDFVNQGGDRFVIWGDPLAFHSWWKATGVKDDYPNPDNTGAFTTADVHSLGVAMKITPLLYSKAPFQGSFSNLKDLVAESTETVDNHKCYRLAGTARDIYGATGRESNVRKMIIWIDAETFLIRKVLEDWKPLPGQISRRTAIFEPQANPPVDEGRFKFTPPK